MKLTLVLLFAAATWDRFLNLDFGGPNLKLHQLFFLLSFAVSFWQFGRRDLAKFMNPLFRPFPLCFLLLALY